MANTASAAAVQGDLIAWLYRHGRVLERRFLGEVELFDVAVQGLDSPLRMRARESVPFRPGADVGIEIDPREVLVFATGEA
jgi:iron(III) transport system ATP-binding protein